jgi:hypothetical protein
LEQDGRSVNKRLVFIVVAVIISVVALFAIWEFALKNYLAEDGDHEYLIDFWQGDDRIGTVTMSELQTLDTVSYEDTLGSGATDEGPLLKDVVLLVLDQSSLSNSTDIRIESDLTGEERTVTWGEVANASNSYILDFTNKGTTKFSSPDTQKKDRVRDVTDIVIGA